jgi:hypothetical protein
VFTKGYSTIGIGHVFTADPVTRLKFGDIWTKCFRNQGGRNSHDQGHVNAALFQGGRHKTLTVMDIIVVTIYHKTFSMHAEEVGTGSSSHQVTPD